MRHSPSGTSPAKPQLTRNSPRKSPASSHRKVPIMTRFTEYHIPAPPGSTPDPYRLHPCPVCLSRSYYAPAIDRYVHADGSANEPCWLHMLRGLPVPAPRTTPTTE